MCAALAAAKLPNVTIRAVIATKRILRILESSGVAIVDRVLRDPVGRARNFHRLQGFSRC
jgi:hypothetical protein